MYFSSIAPNVLKDIEPFVAATLRNLAYPTQLVLNEQKRLHSSKKGRRRVTGIVLPSSGGISLGRPIKRRIRGMVHRWAELTPAERRSLAGLLAYAQSVEPDLVNRLILKFGPGVVARAQSRHTEPPAGP
jgi:RNA-directed DNA polymerase